MEVLFAIVVVLVAYTAYSILDKGGEAKKPAPAAAQKTAAPQPKPEPVARAAAPEAKPEPKQVQAAEVKEEVKPVAAVAAPAEEKTATGGNLRDPKSGEVAAVPANYRFAKRWIKDALVSEGLLDKVYKNSELDGANAAKVKAAMDALKAMPKYQA